MPAILNKENICILLKNVFFNNGSILSDNISSVIFTNHSDSLGISLVIDNTTYYDAERAVKIANSLIYKAFNLSNINWLFIDKYGNQVTKSSKGKILNKGKVISVISGKGGVGKSTLSAILANQLASQGKKVGLIDLDIYSSSLISILNIEGKSSIKDELFLPIKVNNIYVMSFSFFVDNASFLAWRGPMISKIISQLLFSTLWNDLDYLILDTPPGTGDIHLTLLETYIIDKALAVTLPNLHSFYDSLRTIKLYQKFDVEILGLVENMSYFQDDISKKKYNIFGTNQTDKLYKDNGLNTIYKIPIIPNINVALDYNKISKIYY